MNKKYFWALLLLVGIGANAGTIGPCKISEIHQSAGYGKYILIKFECTNSAVPTSNCSGNVSDNMLALDATTEIGKFQA